jgi:hypothetical protein
MSGLYKEMPVPINLPLIAAICAALAGVAGTILTPLYGANLSTAVSAVLQALSGLLVLIPTLHASSVAATTGKLRARAKYESGEWLKETT